MLAFFLVATVESMLRTRLLEAAEAEAEAVPCVVGGLLICIGACAGGVGLICGLGAAGKCAENNCQGGRDCANGCRNDCKDRVARCANSGAECCRNAAACCGNLNCGGTAERARHGAESLARFADLLGVEELGHWIRHITDPETGVVAMTDDGYDGYDRDVNDLSREIENYLKVISVDEAVGHITHLREAYTEGDDGVRHYMYLRNPEYTELFQRLDRETDQEKPLEERRTDPKKVEAMLDALRRAAKLSDSAASVVGRPEHYVAPPGFDATILSDQEPLEHDATRLPAYHDHTVPPPPAYHDHTAVTVHVPLPLA